MELADPEPLKLVGGGAVPRRAEADAKALRPRLVRGPLAHELSKALLRGQLRKPPLTCTAKHPLRDRKLVRRLAAVGALDVDAHLSA